MKTDYVRMSDDELCAAVERKYGKDFDPNDKSMIRKALETDDGLLKEYFRRAVGF